MPLPIFVINMKSSAERWQKTHSRLHSLGLECVRFEATVGKAMSEAEISTWYDADTNLRKHHRNMTPGEIGCYISHMRVWQHIHDKNIPAAIILEDDLLIENHLQENFKNLSQLQDWDMIKLSDNRTNPFIQTKTLSNQVVLGNYLKVPNGGQGYIISQQGVKKLLCRKPFFRPVDVDFQFHSEIALQIFGMKPYPISEDLSFQSEIAAVNAGRHSNHSTFLRNAKHRIAMYLQRKKISGDLSKVIKSR